MTTPRKIVLAAAVVLVALVGGGLYWFFQDDAPEEVNLEDATAGVEDDTTTTTTTATAGTDEPSTEDTSATSDDGDVSGIWTVDTETGDFDYESATGSFVGFRIQEELANIGAATAVGRTGDVTGTMEIDGTTVTDAAFEADLTTITTNESRRDSRVQDALETDQHPSATFELTEALELDDAVAGGEPTTVTAAGDLTIRGVTQPVDVELEAQLVGETVVVVGRTDIVFADFGIEVPSSPIVVSVEDQGVLELQLLLVR